MPVQRKGLFLRRFFSTLICKSQDKGFDMFDMSGKKKCIFSDFCGIILPCHDGRFYTDLRGGGYS